MVPSLLIFKFYDFALGLGTKPNTKHINQTHSSASSYNILKHAPEVVRNTSALITYQAY